METDKVQLARNVKDALLAKIAAETALAAAETNLSEVVTLAGVGGVKSFRIKDLAKDVTIYEAKSKNADTKSWRIRVPSDGDAAVASV